LTGAVKIDLLLDPTSPAMLHQGCSSGRLRAHGHDSVAVSSFDTIARIADSLRS
jgi:hypothetical protein